MGRIPLPSIAADFTGGLVTRWNQNLVQARALLRSFNMDGFDSFGSISKIPGSTRKSNKAPAGWNSLHPITYFDPSGAIQRHVLGTAGGVLYRIESDKSITSLWTGLTAEVYASEVAALNRLHLCSPSNSPIKYDGVTATRWGVLPPGGEKFPVETFDSLAGWAANGSNSVSASAISQQGGASLSLNKLDATVAAAYAEKAGYAVNMVTGVGPVASLFLYIPQGALQKLQSSGIACEVGLGDTAFTNVNRYQWEIGSFYEGWNLLTFASQSPDAITGTGVTLTNVQKIRLTLNFSNAAAVQSGFLFDYFCLADIGFLTPTLGPLGAGSVLGNVSYKVTFLSRYGQESNAGPPSNYVSAAGQTVYLGSIPTSLDPQVIARKIYRDLGDSIYQELTTLFDNTTSTFTDNTSNAGRGVRTPPLPGDAQLDYSPPPKMAQAINYKGYIFGINAVNRQQLEISNFGLPETFPIVNRKIFDEELVGLGEHTNGLMIFCRHSWYLMTGINLSTFRFEKRGPKVGITGPRAIGRIKQALLGFHDEGPFLFDGLDQWYLGALIKDKFESIPPAAYQHMHIAVDRSRFRVVIFLQTTFGGPYDRLLTLGYGRLHPGKVSDIGYGVNPHDLRQAIWNELTLPASVNPICSALVEVTADQPELWIGCSDGYVYRLQDPTALNYANGSQAEAIGADFETQWIKLGAEPGAVGDARFVSFSGENAMPTTWTLTVTYSSDVGGTVYGTSSQEVSFPAGGFQTVVAIDEFVARSGAVTLRMQNSNLGETTQFDELRVYYVPHNIRMQSVA